MLAIAGTTLFSFKSIVIKLGYGYQISAEQTILLRMLFSAPIYAGLLIYHWKRRKLTVQSVWHNKWLLLASGLLGYYLASLLDLKGLELISAQLERLILFTYPGFVMLFSWFIWRTKPGSKTLYSMIVTYLGIVLVVGTEFKLIAEDAFLGGFYVLLSAAFFAAYLVLSKKGIKELGSQSFTCFAMLVATVAVVMHLSVVEQVVVTDLAWQAYFWVLVLSIVCTVIPSLLIAASIARLGPQQTSILGGLGPILTAIFAVFILQEPFGLSHLAGTMLVALGVVLIAFDKTENRH